MYNFMKDDASIDYTEEKSSTADDDRFDSTVENYEHGERSLIAPNRLSSIRDNCLEIPYFPITASGETVYSTICRFAERSGLPDHLLISMLAGHKNLAAVLSPMTGHLGHLSKVMPYGHPWRNAMTIVCSHTTLPYFIYFLRDQVRRQWISRMIEESDPSTIVMSLALTMYPVPAIPHHPRYCSICISEQEQKYGFSYFKREHQLPGVFICPEHETILSYGCNICGPYPIKYRRFCMAGRCNCGRSDDLPVIKEWEDITPLLWIARESSYMVDSSGTKYINARAILKEAATRNGFNQGRQIDYKKLATGIESRFSPDVLKLLGVTVWHGKEPAIWISQLLQDSLAYRKKPTLLILLVLGTLFESISAFEKGCLDSEPSDKKRETVVTLGFKSEFNNVKRSLKVKKIIDWSDLNGHIADGKKINALTLLYKVNRSTVARELRRQGVYYPLSTKTKNYLGNKLTLILNDLKSRIPRFEIMKKYHCSKELLLSIEIDQPFPKPPVRDRHVHRTENKLNTSDLRDKHRSIIEDYLKQIPNPGRQIIRKEMRSTYEYMMRNDKKWFCERVPKIRKDVPRKRNPQKWIQRDQQKSKELLEILNEIKNPIQKPVWLTKYKFLKSIGIYSSYNNNPNLYPSVSDVISRNIETHEEYTDRLFHWARRNRV
jgi:hypothetical protein